MSAAQAEAPRPAVLPPWRIILAMIRFKPWLWLLDLGAVVIFRFAYQVGPGLILKGFFDYLTGAAPAGINIATLAALFVANGLMRALGNVGFFTADIPLFNDVALLLRRNLLQNIFQRPGALPLSEEPGAALVRFTDDVWELMVFILWFNDAAIGICVSITAFLILANINLGVTLAALVPLLLVGLLANAAAGRLKQYRTATREATARVTGFIGEIFGAAQAVKVAGAEGNVTAAFDRLNEARKRVQVRERVFERTVDSIYRNLSSLGTGVVLVMAGQAMRQGTFTIGDFSLFVFLLTSMGDLATFLGDILARYRQLGVSVERMAHLIAPAPPEALMTHSPVDLKAPLPALEQPALRPGERLETLEVRGLSYRHPGSQNGVQGVDLRLERGTLTVLTGRVGSGKTTLLRALLGLLPRDDGEVRWNGQPVGDPARFFTPPRSAYTAQIPRLFSSSLRENILLGLESSDEAVREALRLAVMDQDLAGLEGGLDTRVGPRGLRLSGGQIQRSAAARMLVRRPELLVCDDLSSALDVETERQLWERLFERRGADDARTFLVVSHRRPVLRRADQIIVLKNGRVEDAGRLDELLERCEEMRRLWNAEQDNA